MKYLICTQSDNKLWVIERAEDLMSARSFPAVVGEVIKILIRKEDGYYEVNDDGSHTRISFAGST